MPDLDAARDFYGMVLGFGTPAYDLPEAGWIEFTTGAPGGNLAVTRAAEDWQPSTGTLVVLNVDTAMRPAMNSALAACAATIPSCFRVREPLQLLHPFGNCLQMCSPAPAGSA